MTPQHHPSPPRRSPKAGFALIASISIMAVLVLIGVTLYSLSAVATKSAEIAKARTEAQANAKMALMLAIGDLQKYTGADTRITAPANIVANDEADLEIVDDNMPKLVGVWRSWEGLNHDATGRPIAAISGTPIYDLKQQPNDPGNPSDTGRFLSWLVSSATPGNHLNDPQTLAYLSETTVNNMTTIPLLSAGNEGDDSDGSLRDANPGNGVPKPREIHVLPTLANGDSRFAWWVSPENQKARLAQPHEPRTNSSEALVEMGQSHVVPNPEIFGFNNLNPEPFNKDNSVAGSVNRAINRETLTLIDSSNSAQPHKSFHDLSTNAAGLLTNTATGGWRKCLSLLTEKWDDIYTSYPGGELPLFRYAPISGATSAVPKPTVSNYDPEQSNLYPWSDYSIILGNKNPATYHAASASWASLVSFATSYKNFSYDEGMVESPFVWDAINSANDEKFFKYKHTQRLHPQVARFQFIVYAKATPNIRNPSFYTLLLKYEPVFTLWNPYNVGLSFDIPNERTYALGFGWRRSLPGVLAVVSQATYPNPDSVPSHAYQMFNTGNFQYLDVGGNHGEAGYENVLPENVAKEFRTHFRRGHERVRIVGNLDMRTFMANLPSGPLEFKPGEAKVFSPDGRYEKRFGGIGIGLEEGYSPTEIGGFQFPIAGGLTLDKRFWFLLRTDRLTQPYKNRDPGLGFTLSFGRSRGNPYTGGELHSAFNEELHNLTALAPEDEGMNYWPPTEVDEVGYSVGELASGGWIPIFSTSFGPRMTIGTAPGTQQSRPTKGLVQNNPLASYALGDPSSGEVKDHPVNGTFDFAYHSLSMGGTITPNLSESSGYIATGYQSGDGLSRLILAEIPLRPMASLVELQGWNPRGNNPYPPFQMNLIGNSDATPLIPNNDIVPPTLNPSKTEFNLLHDDAYCANHLLFDDWFVSSIAPHPQVLGGNIAKDMKTVYEEFLKGDLQLSNRAYKPIAADRNLSTSDASSRADAILNRPDGFLKVASRLEVEGMFNVNSTSVDAWKALLGHAKSIAEIGLHGEDTIESASPSNSHAVTRGAVASDVEAGTAPAVGGQFPNASEYTGFRSLTDDQIEDLAEKIVEQVRRRGPFLSLAEFVNRQLSTNDNLALAGAVQSAINNLDEDPMKELRDPANMLSDTTMPESDPKLDGVDYEFSKAAEGSSAYGAPAWIRQADVLRPIAPILSARDDTFTIRAYGDSLDQSGAIVARAWCEAVVKRTRNFCDPSDPADSIEPPVSPTNIRFGRKYEIVAFRWLSPDEV